MNKKQQIMTLWQQSFHDSDEFVRFYFDRKYNDDNSLVYEKNGKALSAFLMLPYPMTWAGTTLRTSYISGACTLPEARNQGLMTILLKTAFIEMNKRGIALSTLIPAEKWLFGYYANQGYTTVFEYADSLYIPQATTDISAIKAVYPEYYDDRIMDDFFPYFERKMQERPCCIQHPFEDYKTIVKDHYLSGGKILVILSNENQPTGMAFVMPGNGQTTIKEMFYDSPTHQAHLLAYVSRKEAAHPIYYRVPASGNNQAYAMARITDALGMLRHIARQYPDISVNIRINDPLLPANDGCFVLSKGECHKTTDCKTDIETNIENLTQALLGYHPELLPHPPFNQLPSQNPYMSLMID